MPTNLPPVYFDVEKRYREATDTSEKIALLEEMYSLVPKHKGTDHLRADLRRQLSRLKTEPADKKKHTGHTSEYNVEKEGAGQVLLIGPPNTGKSALLEALTNAGPEVSEAAFSTRKPIPGMMPYQDIQVQLVDTPSLDRELSEGGLFGLARQADLVLIVVDLQADPLDQALLSLEMLAQHRIAPQELESGYTGQERVLFKPVVLLVNKCDDARLDEDYAACCDLLAEQADTVVVEGSKPLLDVVSIIKRLQRLPVSALNHRNFAELKQAIFKRLQVVRVYARPPGEEPDMERPFVLKEGSTVSELTRKVHRDFFDKLKSVRVWGSSEFPGQMVHKDYELKDGDIVELRI
jgi:uncharacterized protein